MTPLDPVALYRAERAKRGKPAVANPLDVARATLRRVVGTRQRAVVAAWRPAVQAGRPECAQCRGRCRPHPDGLCGLCRAKARREDAHARQQRAEVARKRRAERLRAYYLRKAGEAAGSPSPSTHPPTHPLTP